MAGPLTNATTTTRTDPRQGQHPVNESKLLPGAEKRQHRAPKKYSPGREARAEQRLREQARAAAAAPIDVDGWQVCMRLPRGTLPGPEGPWKRCWDVPVCLPAHHSPADM